MQYQMNLRDAELRGERRGEERGEKIGEARMNQQWEKRWEVQMLGMAKDLIYKGMSIGDVAMMTNLPISKIRELQGEVNLKH